jgi:hypothetical protein
MHKYYNKHLDWSVRFADDQQSMKPPMSKSDTDPDDSSSVPSTSRHPAEPLEQATPNASSCECLSPHSQLLHILQDSFASPTTQFLTKLRNTNGLIFFCSTLVGSCDPLHGERV